MANAPQRHDVLGAIVVVDDDPVARAALTRLLKRSFSHPVVAFESSVEALQWCLQSTPDLIVTDFEMPTMNGLELVRRLRQEAQLADVPVMVVTIATDRTTRYQALDVGANDFLGKPLDVPEVLLRTRNMLTLRENQRAMASRAQWLAHEVAKATATLAAREEETIWRLAKATEFRDNETGTHIARIAHYSRLIARELGLSDDVQETLFLSAPMHDVGKIAIPDYILQKPGKLNESELLLMQRHTVIGYDILGGSNSPLLNAAAEIALTHHERFDGTGYPNRMQGTAIPLYGRIVAVADVFDALTTRRPYKKAWTVDAAFAVVRESRGHHFDPSCADAFLSVPNEVLGLRERLQDVDPADGALRDLPLVSL